jgi:hypothetical protein
MEKYRPLCRFPEIMMGNSLSDTLVRSAYGSTEGGGYLTMIPSSQASILIYISILFFPLFATRSQAQDCDPPCRSGYQCKNGTCISQCNPPCPETQTCDSTSHDCVPSVSESKTPKELHNTGGFATASAITGFVLSPIILGLTIGSAATSGNGLAPALPLGASALGTSVVSVPIIAVGGALARSSDKVKGVLALRIAGWLGYGLSIGTGALMVGMAVGGGTIPPEAIIACGLLGTFSCISLSIDNFISGAQAKKYYSNVQEEGATVPELTFGIGPYRHNGATVQVGLRY